jgi:2-iminobutanoate/2-iminopropanoate deaminase
MQVKKSFNTTKVLRTNPVFPQAMIADNFIFLSGTVGINSLAGTIISDDFEEQARLAFTNDKQFWKKQVAACRKL